jgi:uncharacterized protein
VKLPSARVRGLVAGWLVSVACASSPEPQFYTLFPDRGSTWASGPLEVQLRRPGLPSYLDRPQIVRHEQPGQLEFLGAARWAAPLEDMVGGVLAQNLAQRLPEASVYTESGAISSSPDAVVEIEIQRFELSEHGSIELIAQVAVHWPKTLAKPRLERYASSRSPSSRSTVQLVTQMSELLAELANEIAQSLTAGSPPAQAPAAPPTDAPESPPSSSTPAPPAASSLSLGRPSYQAP